MRLVPARFGLRQLPRQVKSTSGGSSVEELTAKFMNKWPSRRGTTSSSGKSQKHQSQNYLHKLLDKLYRGWDLEAKDQVRLEGGQAETRAADGHRRGEAISSG